MSTSFSIHIPITFDRQLTVEAAADLGDAVSGIRRDAETKLFTPVVLEAAVKIANYPWRIVLLGPTIIVQK